MKLQSDENIRYMLQYYSEIGNMINNFKSLTRHFKLQMLDDLPHIDLKKIKDKKFLFFPVANTHWSVIKKFSESCIITGSLALKAFGLLERNLNNSDIDFFIIDQERIEYPYERLGRQYYEDNFKGNWIGTYKLGKSIIDFFEWNNQEYIEFEGLKFHNPWQILCTKLELLKSDGSYKHFEDIKFYLNKKGLNHSDLD